MSQRMDYDEPGGQQQVPPFDSYQSGYRDPFANSFGQKIPTGSSSQPQQGNVWHWQLFRSVYLYRSLV